MEAALVQCLRRFAAKKSRDVPTLGLAAMNEHFFRLNLEWSSGAASSGDAGPSSRGQATDCGRGHGTTLVELDVSVPPGFGEASWHTGDQSFLATLPGTATHGPAVANQHGINLASERGSRAKSEAQGSSTTGPARAHPFSESQWEQVQEAIQQLNEKLDRIHAAPAEASSSSHAPVDWFKSLDAVLEAVGRFGEKVVRICFKGGKGKAVADVDARPVDSDDDLETATARSEDDSLPGMEEDASGMGDDDDLQVVGEVKPLEKQAGEANAICREASQLCTESAVAAVDTESASVAALLRWCSAAPWSPKCCIVLAFDVHGLGAGKLEAMDSFGITQPLLLVLLRFTKSDWASWAPHGSTRGTGPQPLPKPDMIQAFQAASVEEAQERLHKYFKYNTLESGFRSELPLEWWGDHWTGKGPAARQGSASKRKLSQRESEDPDDSVLSWDVWLQHVAQGQPGAPKSNTPKCRPEDLDAQLQRLQLVVQDQVKDRQKRALQTVIPRMVESFCQGPRAAAPSPAAKKGKGKDKGKREAVVTPQQEQHEKLQVQSMEGDEYAGRALQNAVLPLCVFLAHQLCCLHKKCPSCGELLPVATSRLRTCANPLCLYNSEELGPNISVYSDLKGAQAELADFQLDLAYAATGENARDVFEPFPSFLLRNDDKARGRAGWFESQGAGSSSSNGAGRTVPPVPPVQPLVRGVASVESHQSLKNKRMDVARDLLCEMPPMTALAAASSTEASLKLQLGAAWLRFLITSRQIADAAQAKRAARGRGGGQRGEGARERQAEGDLARPFQLYDFLRFVLFTNRLTFMPLLESAFELPLTGCQYQFMILRDSPERQAYYEERRAQFKGAPFFAFHGSSGINWFSILRNGLRSMSNTHYMSTGAAYGSGLYLSTHGGTSIGYAPASLGRQQGKLRNGFRCLALCEVLVPQDKDGVNKGNGIIMVPAEDAPNVFLRYLLVLEGGADAASSWVISQGTQLQQASGEAVDLRKHMQECMQAHAAQQQQEVEQIWRARAGLVHLTLPPAASTNGGGGKHELAGGAADSDADYAYEEEEEEEDEEDEVFEYLEEVKLDIRSASENKASSNGQGSDRNAAPIVDKGQAKPPAPARQPPTNSAPGASASSSQPQAASSLRGQASVPSSQHGASSSSAPPSRAAPRAAGGKAGASRSQSASKAVQQEFRKLSKLQESGNSSLPKGGFEVALADESDFFRWEIRLRPCIFDDSTLKPDLRRAAEQQQVPEVPVRLEVRFPDDFPFQPPFVRVVSPRFAFHTGHITVGGSICMELLTASGWSPAYTMEAVIVQIIAEMCEGGARLDPAYMGRAGTAGEYSMQEAKDAFTRVAAQHGWRT